MSKYYNNDIPNKIYTYYGGRNSGKTQREMTKLLVNLSPSEVNDIKCVKNIVTNLKDEDLKTLVKILLGNRYNEFIERIYEINGE